MITPLHEWFVLSPWLCSRFHWRRSGLMSTFVVLVNRHLHFGIECTVSLHVWPRGEEWLNSVEAVETAAKSLARRAAKSTVVIKWPSTSSKRICWWWSPSPPCTSPSTSQSNCLQAASYIARGPKHLPALFDLQLHPNPRHTSFIPRISPSKEWASFQRLLTALRIGPQASLLSLLASSAWLMYDTHTYMFETLSGMSGRLWSCFFCHWCCIERHSWVVMWAILAG